jgi:tetratricopeptide (TPR) repeat protein
VQAALDFERVATPAQRRAVWSTLTARWPEDLLAALGLGGALHDLGDLPAAAATFAAAAARHDSAAAWNNLAVTEAARGRRPQALAALARAQARVASAEPQWAEAVAGTARELGADAPR